MSQNFFSQAINTKTRLKRRAVMSRYFMWIIIVSFFQSSKRLAMVVMAALINWVEMCWRATGDSGSVAKLGQCQTLQPWLSLFLSESTFFHTLTPFLPLSTHTTFLSHAHLCLFFFFPQSSQYPGQVHRAAW